LEVFQVELAVHKAVATLPIEGREEAAIKIQKDGLAAAGVRHADDIANSMELPSLKIIGLPAFTPDGLRVKARLAEFNLRACGLDLRLALRGTIAQFEKSMANGSGVVPLRLASLPTVDVPNKLPRPTNGATVPAMSGVPAPGP
jgi:hypothetical protein